jgi:membrane-associated protease RseP (regulator of RpoE activity)
MGIVVALLVLSVLIFFHELGHFTIHNGVSLPYHLAAMSK